MRRSSPFLFLMAAIAVATGCTDSAVVGGIRSDGGMDATADVTCVAPQTACGGACVDTQSSADHCGACGTVCARTQVCVAGQCQIGCPMGQTACNGRCVDLQTDRASCGACGTACAAGLVCSMGRCTLECGAGLAQCGGGGDGGADAGGVRFCTNPQTDRANCGACGNACAAGQICERGACVANCPAGQLACGGICADVQSDALNCGACGRACASGEACVAGACQVRCPTGQAVCAGRCADLQTDRGNCGVCGTVCDNGEVCSMGTCGLTCGQGLTTCTPMNGPRACANLQTDRANCGACGTACGAGQVCERGACVLSCPMGQTACGGLCTDTQSDRANCGACGNPCGAGQVCAMGTCATSCQAGAQNCSGTCRNTSTDVAACGACGNACPTPTNGAAFCANGACGISCNRGFGDCDGNAMNGCETSLDALTNCGGCGVRCNFANARGSCVSSGCALGACNLGFANCDSDGMNGCEVNTQADNANCGACGNACGAGQRCAAGVCVATCISGQTDCTGACRDLANDPANCGACGNACARPANATPFCAGRCAFQCSAGFGDCDGNAGNGCETALTSVSNCGACGFTCRFSNGASACTAGACQLTTCDTGFANCDNSAVNGCEVNTQSDRANCGACNNACGAGQVCSAGVCRATCASGLTECAGSCTSTQTDPRNCGACGTVCAAPANAAAVCTAGGCSFVCNAGFRDCDGNPSNGCEVNTNTSNANCGACSRACTIANANAVCTNGACQLQACTGSFRDCDNNPANGCEVDSGSSTANCGACGNVCNLPNATAACTSGACAVSACTGTFRNCDNNPSNGCEVNTASSPQNCGACGTVCNSGVCNNGVCQVSSNRYQQSFVSGQDSTGVQCTTWNTWRAGLTGTYTRVTIRGTFNSTGVSCTNPSVVNALAQSLRNGTEFNMACDGNTWSNCGSRYDGELWLNPPSTCSGANCPSGYIVRPCIGAGNPNWGGVNTQTCSAPSQEMIVEFQ
jgi:Stigma-specific protein, Stig1